MQNNNTQLQVIDVIESSGLEPDTTKTLKERFLPFWEQAEEWKKKAETLVVTDESQTAEMKMARVARLAIRQIRIDADKTRKALKEDNIRYGRAVQGIYNVIEYMIKPIEEHLLEQEQFVEIRQQEARDRLNEERETIASLLSDYIDYAALPPTNAPWADITEEQFEVIMDKARDMQKTHKAELERLEAERIAKEAENKRIREENAKLKAEAEERERAAAEERRKLEERARKEREAAAAALAKERAEREALEAENQRKAEEQRKKYEAEALAELARLRAEEDARQKAEAAPDREKLLNFAAELSAINTPAVKVKAAKNIAKEVEKVLANLAAWIADEVEKTL